ncbi:cupin domain-containing protein [Mucilaginibacter sp. X4EP1]|uniref:cupin domain-containing protein n=1 Tax=Mucilaginibacter sp. X4EP1 TaxID=2723092 RepID=UPI0021695D45|nr:cupin domain-containing protein [Mucilaginibacter sp. X4EP1]MCS3813770.1 mannose-6-phosphate isomerase-like protein (cupin superfamily) [Mucilaginibacter sp. X4EP1]
MDVKKFIHSGILEEYVLGLLGAEYTAYVTKVAMLFPSIKRELTAIEESLQQLALDNAVEPAPQTKLKILNTLGFADQDINQMPPIDKNTDLQTWLNVTDHLIAEEPQKYITFRQLRKDEKLQQMLIISKVDIPEENHNNYLESFFILKGYCECAVGDVLFQLGPGDFLEIPLYVKHNVKLTSPYVAAVLQYQFV